MLIGATALALPTAIFARSASKHRIGIVFNIYPMHAVSGEKPAASVMRGFLEGLREAGFAEGRNVVIERRTAEGNLERLPALIRDLAELPVDVIVVNGNAATLAAKNATTRVPIVTTGMGNPVELGVAAQLSRPGGNITGLVPTFGRELPLKRLELLHELVPDARRIAVFGARASMEIPENVATAAAAMGLTLRFVDARLPNIAEGLVDLQRERADALIVSAVTPLYPHLAQIAAAAAKMAVPDVYGFHEAVEAGGLASYGIDSVLAWRRAARYVAHVLEGAKPGDLPIEQLDRYRLVVNTQRAKALRLTIPQSVRVRADEVL
jgi:putative ABC transport system substrate-binding protein